MAFTLRSSAFRDGDVVPRRHTCDGEDSAPPLAWEGPPAGTHAFALVLDDPDAPSGTFTHWLVCDLPGNLAELDGAGALAGGATEGTNDFGRIGYGGPCPPRGHGPHRYRFHLHALQQPLRLPRGFSRREFDTALEGHVLGTAMLQGVYARGRR
jgi:Raf kinase inhibitor-like YbhB/YbcL family protein